MLSRKSYNQLYIEIGIKNCFDIVQLIYKRVQLNKLQKYALSLLNNPLRTRMYPYPLPSK